MQVSPVASFTTNLPKILSTMIYQSNEEANVVNYSIAFINTQFKTRESKIFPPLVIEINSLVPAVISHASCCDPLNNYYTIKIQRTTTSETDQKGHAAYSSFQEQYNTNVCGL